MKQILETVMGNVGARRKASQISLFFKRAGQEREIAVCGSLPTGEIGVGQKESKQWDESSRNYSANEVGKTASVRSCRLPYRRVVGIPGTTSETENSGLVEVTHPGPQARTRSRSRAVKSAGDSNRMRDSSSSHSWKCFRKWETGRQSILGEFYMMDKKTMLINLLQSVVNADHSKPCHCCRCLTRLSAVGKARAMLDRMMLEEMGHA